MTVFSGVVAILSPAFVSKFVKDAGRGDVLSKMQSEYGVTYMKTSEDICTIQGEWDAVNKVYSFLREAETGAVVDSRQQAMARDASTTAATLKQRASEGKQGSRASLLAQSSDFDGQNQSDISMGSDIQIVATWGNFSEDALPFFPPGEGSQNSSANSTPQQTLPQTTQIVQVLDANGVPIKSVPGRSLLKSNIFKVEPTKSEEMTIVGSILKSDDAGVKDEKKTKTFVLCQPVPLKRKNKPAVAKKSTAKRAKLTIAKKAPLKIKIERPKVKTESVEAPVIKNEQNSFELENTSLGLTEGMYGCESCTKVFMEKPALEVHTYVYHNSECSGTNIQCPYCQKVFLSKNGLEEHMYNHVGTRPFACHLCSTSFNHRKSLRRHMETHQDLKKYPCLVCEQSFTRKESLDAHIALHGKDYTSFRVACKLCFIKFTNMGAYKKHIRSKHPDTALAREVLERDESQQPAPAEKAGESTNLASESENEIVDTENVSKEDTPIGDVTNDATEDASKTEQAEANGPDVDVDSIEEDDNVAESETSVTDTSAENNDSEKANKDDSTASLNESSILHSPPAPTAVSTSEMKSAETNISSDEKEETPRKAENTSVQSPDKKSKGKKSPTVKKSPKPKATSTPVQIAKQKEPIVAKVRSARICERRLKAERERELAEKGQRKERDTRRERGSFDMLKDMMEEDGHPPVSDSKASSIDGHKIVKPKKSVGDSNEMVDVPDGAGDGDNVKVSSDCDPDLVGDLCLDMEDAPAKDAVMPLENHSTTSDTTS